MKWFSSLPTRSKLFLGFGVMLAFLLAVMAVAYMGMASIQNSYKVAVGLVELRADLNRQRAQFLELMSEPDRREERISQIKSRTQVIDRMLATLSVAQRGDKEFIGGLERLQVIRNEYLKMRDAQIALIDQGRVAEVRQLGTIGTNNQATLFEQMGSISKQLGERAQKQADQRAENAGKIFAGAGMVALLAGVIMALFLNRLIATPLKDISSAAERIAAGDLTVDISCDDRRDEVGALTQSFNRMSQSLQNMAGVAKQMAAGDLKVQVKPQSDQDVLGNSFAVMVQNLQRMTADVTEAVNVLGSSASEIVASTTQLASGATETATAVSETTTTVEEIRQTAQVANDKARQVADRALNSSRISQDGKQSIAQTSDGMQRIRQQMESIAQSMVSLSEQSQAIGDIIATVDDLAQQSNLLAVNASIEAAKAGEQGKGFAVVAQEVKSLADQSKQATTQVRTILNDIQKATGAAVMATEQGSKAVEAGVVQAVQAGESLMALTESVDDSARAATQIAASSQQQLVGMDQMVSAMESINQASVQNVDSARQLETAAQGLNDLGQRLRELVGRYTV